MLVHVFPPFSPVGHSIRAVKFIKYLPALGWLPVVLTVDDQQEYETLRKVGSAALLSQVDPRVKVVRTKPGEPSRIYVEKELAFAGKNWLTHLMVKIWGGARRRALRYLLLPDRYLTWLPSAAKRGRELVLSEGIDVIFATCPPHSTVVLGALLKRLTGKPLVLDYRDDWIDTPWFLSKPAVSRTAERRLEKWAVRTADRVILVTEWSRRAFQARYPAEPASKFILISNGCDLEDICDPVSPPLPSAKPKFTIVHAGSLNVSKVWGRSPLGFFQALQKLLREHPEAQGELELVLAGDVPAEQQEMIKALGLSGVVRLLGNLPHDEVPRLNRSADLLLAMNYDGWATLIPAKMYEYWAVGGAPILLLSCPGAAAEFVERHHLGFAADPRDVDGICRAILDVFHRCKSGMPWRVSRTGIEAYDRQALTARLGDVLSGVCQEGTEGLHAGMAHTGA